MLTWYGLVIICFSREMDDVVRLVTAMLIAMVVPAGRAWV